MPGSDTCRRVANNPPRPVRTRPPTRSSPYRCRCCCSWSWWWAELVVAPRDADVHVHLQSRAGGKRVAASVPLGVVFGRVDRGSGDALPGVELHGCGVRRDVASQGHAAFIWNLPVGKRGKRVSIAGGIFGMCRPEIPDVHKKCRQPRVFSTVPPRTLNRRHIQSSSNLHASWHHEIWFY